MKRVIISISVILFGTVLMFSGCQQASVTSAKVYIQQNSYDTAIELCQKAIESQPDDSEAYFVLGEAYAGKEMYREMNEAYNKAEELGTKHTAEIEENRQKFWFLSFNNGVRFINSNQIERAVESFAAATELLPDKIEAFKNLAYSYAQMDRGDDAVETYKRAREVDPDDLEVIFNLGRLLYRMKDYDGAISYFQEAITKADPASDEAKEALYNLAFSYDLKGESDKAIEAYETALKASPGDKDLIFNMARLHLIQENYAEAIETFKRVLTIDPDDADANEGIGDAYVRLEKFEESIPYLEKASKMKTEDSRIWQLLGISYARTGQPEKAQAAFDRAEELQKQ